MQTETCGVTISRLHIGWAADKKQLTPPIQTENQKKKQKDTQNGPDFGK